MPFLKLLKTNSPTGRSIFLLGVMSLIHLLTFAQGNTVQKKFKLIHTDGTVREAFVEIASLTGYQFSYNNEDVNLNKKVHLSNDSQSLKQLLDALSQQGDFKYIQKEATIVIMGQEEKQTQISPKIKGNAFLFGPVTGKVTGSDGKPLAKVTVTEKGTGNATTTDENGQFTITVKDANAVLVFSYVGFGRMEQAVNNSTDLSITMTADVVSAGEVTVVGTRSSTKRTKVETPLPVDVLSSAELQNTGQVDVGQMMQFVSPSFNSSKNGINGAANYADPATLRGLSPDQMLVLVNGKRRHQFSALNLNVTIGKGTVVTDMNTIPSLAIERIEVLRDGAAAQYGSDAIAGIANLAIKKTVDQGMAKLQYGSTKEGDGQSFLAAVNYGFKLGKPKSYLNFTLHYQDVQGTQRSDPFNGNIYIANSATSPTLSNFREDSVRAARGVWPSKIGGTAFKVSTYGSNATKAYQFFANAGFPINERWTAYAFGGYSKKEIRAFGFFRNAIATDGNSNPAVHPNGYAPELPGTTNDYSISAGVKKEMQKGWNIDFSTTYGYNSLDQEANNTSNPSMGFKSPKNFYVGQSSFGQSTTEITFVKNFEDLWGTKSFNLALGSMYRVDQYQLKRGDQFSYLKDTTARGKAYGSSGRPGIAPDEETNTNRSNIGVYVDVESDLSDQFLLALALRYENYSDFGGNLSGKLAARYKASQNFSIRGSLNRGFRAPSLQQIANSITTSTVQAGVIRQTKQIASSDARLRQLGIVDPKAETSWNYSVGVTATTNDNKFQFTIDAYQIDIADRIIVTENLGVTGVPALVSLFAGLDEVAFFTNSIDTRTQGVEFVASYRQKRNGEGLNGSLAFTFNETKINNIQKTPDQLQAGATRTIALIDTISISLIETSQPRQKVVLSLGYKIKRWDASVRATYFGEVISWEKPTGANHRSQTFSGKTLVDVSLAYSISKNLVFSVGSNNLFDVYPDKVFSNYNSFFNGQTPYTRNANQFGFNGASYYGNLTLKF